MASSQSESRLLGIDDDTIKADWRLRVAPPTGKQTTKVILLCRTTVDEEYSIGRVGLTNWRRDLRTDFLPARFVDSSQIVHSTALSSARACACARIVLDVPSVLECDIDDQGEDKRNTTLRDSAWIP